MSPLSRIIAEEIRLQGPVSLARFMELALYCPVYGYYERDADRIGQHGDFQTSISVGPLFGELLAWQLTLWMDQSLIKPEAIFHWVEAGAYDGRLAADILGWMRERRPAHLDRFRYHILEPSPSRMARQRQTLVRFLQHVCWSSSWEQLKHTTGGGVRGTIFANELLDAQPVHRLAWDRARGSWMEWRVGLDGERFVWSRHASVPPQLLVELEERVPEELRDVLPDGYVVELSPGAEDWWREAAQALRRGWLLTFDYGFGDETALLPERTGGTLRGYHQHQATSEVLARPGEQDITAHVHFDRIRRVGEAAGLQTEFLGEQGRFLTRCVATMMNAGGSPPAWDSSRLRQFQTLIHPDHFGRSFQALLQSRL